MRRTAVLIAAVLAGGLAAGQAAAAPVKVGNAGERPWVFVDRQGVTHVTWDLDEGLQTRTFYARALPGARTFSAPVEIPIATGEDFAGSYVTQDPAPSNRLVLVTERSPSVTGQPLTYAVTSTDNGVTWSAATAIGDPGPSVNPGEGRVNLVANGTPGIWIADGNPTFRILKVNPTLTPLVTTADLVSISDKPYDGQVQFDAAGQPIFAFGSLSQGFVKVGEGGAEQLAFTSDTVPSIHLATGPAGNLVMGTGGPVANTSIRVRTLNGGTLGPEIRISAPGDDNTAFAYLSADQSGRFHAVWRSNGEDLNYRTSPNGTTWSPIKRLVRITRDSIYPPVVAAGPDGKGWVVYNTQNTGTGPVWAVRTDEENFAEPDTTGVDNPQVRRRGSSVFITPRTPSLAKLRKRKCVNVRVQSTKPATIRVAIFSGRKSIRVFGATVVRFRQPGKRLVCVKVPLRARTFDVRQPFRFAFAVKSGANPRRNAPAQVTTTGFTFFK
ncbi:MAG: hypothetical protein U0237_20140 [Thermoleophilia bacterium]